MPPVQSSHCRRLQKRRFFSLLHVQIEISKGVDVNFLTHVSSHFFFLLKFSQTSLKQKKPGAAALRVLKGCDQAHLTNFWWALVTSCLPTGGALEDLGNVSLATREPKCPAENRVLIFFSPSSRQ